MPVKNDVRNSGILLILALSYPVDGQTPNASDSAAPRKKTPAIVEDDPPPPPFALARLGNYRFWHGGDQLISIAVTSNGKFVVTGQTPGEQLSSSHTRYWLPDDHRLRVFELATGRKLQHLEPPTGDDFVAISPDGKLLATMWDGITIWDLATGKQRQSLSIEKGDIEQIPALRFLTDGLSLAAISKKGTYYVWKGLSSDVTPMKPYRFTPPLRNSDELQERYENGVISPDGKFVALAISLWQPQGAGRRQRQERLVRLYDARRGSLLFKVVLPGFEGNVDNQVPMIFSPDSNTLAVGWKEIQLWDIAKKKLLRKFPGFDKPAGGYLTFSANGCKLGSLQSDGKLQVWEVPGGKKLLAIDIGGQGSSHFEAAPLLFSPDDRFIVVGTSPKLTVLDAVSGRRIRLPSAHSKGVIHIWFTLDGRKLETRSSEAAYEWPVSTWKPKLLWNNEEPIGVREAFLVGVSDKNLFMSRNAEVSVTGPRAPTEGVRLDAVLKRLEKEEKGIVEECFTPTSYLWGLVSKDEKRGFIWDVFQGRMVSEVPLQDYEGSGIGISPDGERMAWVGRQSDLVIAEARSGKIIQKLGANRKKDPHECFWARISFSPDNQYLALYGRGFESKLRLWHLPSEQELSPARALTPPDEFQTYVHAAFSPNGRMLAIAGRPLSRPEPAVNETTTEGTIFLFELATGLIRRRFQGHRGSILSLAFSPDGNRLASGSLDTTVLIWDLARSRNPPFGSRQPVDRQFAEWWQDLASTDGERAYDAMIALAGTPDETTNYIRERLQPVPSLEANQIEQLVSDLGDPVFRVRERANKILRGQERLAEAALRMALARKPGLEVRRRIEQLLSLLPEPVREAELMRGLRALEILENLRAPGALAILERLAKGQPRARLTREAQAAINRMAHQRPK